MPDEEIWFSHEKLEVYQESIQFVAWLADLLETVDRAADLKEQLDSASASISLNLAEGNGKFQPRDRCKFFDIAHASALECASGLDVLVARRKVPRERIRDGKARLQKVVRMILGLIKRNSDRPYRK